MAEQQATPLTRMERLLVEGLLVREQQLGKDQQKLQADIQYAFEQIAERLELSPDAFRTTHELIPDEGIVRLRRTVPPPPAPTGEQQAAADPAAVAAAGQSPDLRALEARAKAEQRRAATGNTPRPFPAKVQAPPPPQTAAAAPLGD